MTTPRKTAVVTGASRGIGRAVALAFIREGYTVWALARSKEALDALRAEAGEALRPLPLDVTDEAALLAACRTILQDGTPSVLVNNAGISISAPLTKTRTEDLNRVMAINVTAPYLFCRELMPAMAAAGGGRVINIGSMAAVRGAPYTSAYCASKHALLGITRSLALEYGRKGVTVNQVNPGWVETDMLSQAVGAISKTTGRSEQQARETLSAMNATGRVIQPEEVAAACLYLASEATASLTGAALPMGATDFGG
jgi:NAD(P)-dependent dehydrogenase (short-subunit alcohol dehydrogenase family)